MKFIYFAPTEEGQKAYKEYKKRYDAIFEERYKKECINPDDPKYSYLSEEEIETANWMIKELLKEELWGTNL